jgi:hypothetical protein
MGEGWGAISFGGKEKTLSSDYVAAPVAQARGQRSSF